MCKYFCHKRLRQSLSDTLEEVLSSSGEKSKEELSKIRSKAEQALKQS
ncbi:DUF883 family protein, partial [Escherichia coli]